MMMSLKASEMLVSPNLSLSFSFRSVIRSVYSSSRYCDNRFKAIKKQENIKYVGMKPSPIAHSPSTHARGHSHLIPKKNIYIYIYSYNRETVN